MKRLASVSMDLDNQWTYLKTHGDSSWETLPSYLEVLAPRVIDALDRLDLTITFFVVGQDAARQENADALRMLADEGHEVANHSYYHEPWLHLYTKDQIRREIESTHDLILKVTGKEPVGFRGPGYSWSPDLLEVLADMGYGFDATMLPTFIGPIARAYYFRQSNFSHDEREQRRHLFGSVLDGFRPIVPYHWRLADGRRLLEIPVTTMPIFRVPFHLSYLIYLSRISLRLMRTYFRIAMGLCALTGVGPSFLLHPLDLLGGDLVPGMQFFPGMDVATEVKEGIFSQVLQEMADWFEVVPMSRHKSALEDAIGGRDVRVH